MIRKIEKINAEESWKGMYAIKDLLQEGVGTVH